MPVQKTPFLCIRKIRQVFNAPASPQRKAEETQVVGDMPVDVLMGKGAGTYTCAVTYGNSNSPQLEEAGADFIIDDVAELIPNGVTVWA